MSSSEEEEEDDAYYDLGPADGHDVTVGCLDDHIEPIGRFGVFAYGV